MRLDGRTALVTGASKGIGSAIALAFAREGARVAIHYHSDPPGAEAVAQAAREMGAECWTVQASIRDPGQIRRMFEELDRIAPPLDILVNNAAVTGWTPVWDATVDSWDAVLETNLRGSFFCSLEAARRMRAGGRGGSIVNVSTNCAHLGVKNLAAYASSKGALHALTVQLAAEFASYGIRVNTFAPGPTQVERNLHDDPDYDRNWGSVVPLGRTAQAAEMTGAALFLASEESSYMTGQVFYVDGGWSTTGRIPESNLDCAAARRHSTKETA